MSEILKFIDEEALAKAAADLFIQLAQQAIYARGRFNAALSGGATPRRMYQILTESDYERAVEWDKVFIFWSDERCVPPTHPNSNFRMAQKNFLDQAPIPAENIHRMRGEIEPQEAAWQYEALLHGHFYPGQGQGKSLPPPSFDLILLGLGTDGHTASLFPGSTALQEQQHWVAANYIEKLASWRLTLTLPVINAARAVVFLVAGAAKAGVLAQIWQAEPNSEDLPARLVQPEFGKLLWLVAV